MDRARARATREMGAVKQLIFVIFSPVLVFVLVLLRSGLNELRQVKPHIIVENKGLNDFQMKADETRFKGCIVF